MTSWAVQPSAWGNELKANAEFGHSFDRIQDIALDWATDQMEAMTIWKVCLLYTSPSPRDVEESRMPSSA